MATTTRKPVQHSHRLGSIWVTPEMKAALDRLSVASGRSMNEIVRDALAAELKRRARSA